jgi:hypothetical protein
MRDMKTLRDWLLASHEAAVPDLNRLRQADGSA